jgi:tetratricopeptide (TPR) repeat protein
MPDPEAIQNHAAETYYQLGIGYELSEESEEAIGAFRRALAIRPDLNEARMHLILLHTRLGDADEAVRECAALKRYDEDLAAGLLESLKSTFVPLPRPTS